MTEQQTRYAAAGAVVIAALAWIDLVFLPLITLGPIVCGAIAGVRGVAARPVAAMWFAAGMLMLASDLAINQEDAAFHAIVAVLTATLAAAFTVLGRRLPFSARAAGDPAR
jgi:hypothetical protein